MNPYRILIDSIFINYMKHKNVFTSYLNDIFKNGYYMYKIKHCLTLAQLCLWESVVQPWGISCTDVLDGLLTTDPP